MKHIAWDFGAIDTAFTDLGLQVVQQKTCKTLCGKRVIVINALPFPSHADDVECDECLTIADESEAIAELLSQ